MRACGRKRHEKKRERMSAQERESLGPIAPLFMFFFYPPPGLPYVNWVSQECCLFYLRSSPGPGTFLFSIFSGFSLPCLLATTILDSFFLFYLPNRKQQLEMDMEQQTGSKWGKEYIKAVYCHPAYLTYMQNTSCKMPGWVKHKQESRFLGEISITSDMQMTPPFWQKAKKNLKSLLMKVKEESEKVA